MSSTVNIPSEVTVIYDSDSPPGIVLDKTSRSVTAVSETNIQSAKVLGLQGRFSNRLRGMRNGSVVAELDFEVNIAYKQDAELAGIGKFIFKHILILQSAISNLEILNREAIIGIQTDLSVAANESGTRLIPAYMVPKENEVADEILKYQDAMDMYLTNESCRYSSEFGTINLSQRKITSKENNSSILTKETAVRKYRTVVGIRKPDLLGTTMWEVRHQDKTVKVAILDLDWLMNFKSERMPIRSGSGLDVGIVEKDNIGYDGQLIETKYYIEHVFGLVANT